MTNQFIYVRGPIKWYNVRGPIKWYNVRWPIKWYYVRWLIKFYILGDQSIGAAHDASNKHIDLVAYATKIHTIEGEQLASELSLTEILYPCLIVLIGSTLTLTVVSLSTFLDSHYIILYILCFISFNLFIGFTSAKRLLKLHTVTLSSVPCYLFEITAY